METPLISVLLPVYEHEAYLMDAVQSIINQTYPDWELLILNDNWDIELSIYEKIDSRISVYESSHQSKHFQINLGLQQAEGDYIAFQDADDISIEQRLQLSLENIGNATFLYGDSISLLKDGTRQYNKCQDLNIAQRSLGSQGSYFFKKSDIKYPEIGRGDDWVFIAKCIQAGMKFKYLPLPLYYYRDYTGNFRTNSNKMKRYFSNRKLKKLVTQIT